MGLLHARLKRWGPSTYGSSDSQPYALNNFCNSGGEDELQTRYGVKFGLETGWEGLGVQAYPGNTPGGTWLQGMPRYIGSLKPSRQGHCRQYKTYLVTFARSSVENLTVYSSITRGLSCNSAAPFCDQWPPEMGCLPSSSVHPAVPSHRTGSLRHQN